MVIKFVFLAAALACANSGLLHATTVGTVSDSAAPAVSNPYLHQAASLGVAHAPLAVTHASLSLENDAPSAISATHQSVVSNLGGNKDVSHYSKSVDSAFSSVEKYDTGITNNGLALTHAPILVSSYAAHAPFVVLTHASSPLLAGPVLAGASVAYSPATIVAHTTFDGLGAHYAW